jgi:hypothetical protein
MSTTYRARHAGPANPTSPASCVSYLYHARHASPASHVTLASRPVPRAVARVGRREESPAGLAAARAR